MRAPKYIKNHPMFTESDFNYLKNKGYSNREILKIWERDIKSGSSPVNHDPSLYLNLKLDSV